MSYLPTDTKNQLDALAALIGQFAYGDRSTALLVAIRDGLRMAVYNRGLAGDAVVGACRRARMNGEIDERLPLDLAPPHATVGEVIALLQQLPADYVLQYTGADGYSDFVWDYSTDDEAKEVNLVGLQSLGQFAHQLHAAITEVVSSPPPVEPETAMDAAALSAVSYFMRLDRDATASRYAVYASVPINADGAKWERLGVTTVEAIREAFPKEWNMYATAATRIGRGAPAEIFVNEIGSR